MLKLIQAKYDFTDYQIAQLKYFFLTLTAELSKLLIMGIYFRDNIPLYVCAIVLLHLLRSSSGGIHCKTYWGCFLLSFAFLVLAIDILPMFSISKFYQLLGLLFCIIITHQIGPLTSAKHPILSEEVCNKLKYKIVLTIFIYYVLLFIMPQNQYIATGFWVIILNTLQLTIAKVFTKGGQS